MSRVPSFRHLAVFVVILVILRRFAGVPVSIVGSLVLTILVTLAISALDRRRP